jgi:hypothetical protein
MKPQIKTIKPHTIAPLTTHNPVIYKCCFNGCGKTSVLSSARCKHGRAEIEMRRVIDVGAMYADDKPVKNVTAGAYTE